jgi:hypothetical protein
MPAMSRCLVQGGNQSGKVRVIAHWHNWHTFYALWRIPGVRKYEIECFVPWSLLARAMLTTTLPP